MLAGGLTAAGLGPGSQVPEFTVKSLEGQDVTYSSMAGDVTVVTFVATQCPVSNAYNERMKSLYNDYGGKDVKFVFINSNRQEDATEVKGHAASNGFEFAVYKDPNNAAADLFGASVTPEVFLIKDGVVVYHGRIDDAQKGEIKDHTLRKALDTVLNGGTPTSAETKAFGCTIKRVS